jgi:hypothetical protein
MYFTIVIFGIGILLLFRVLSFLNKILPFSKEFKHYSGYLLPVLELASWLGFAIWCMRFIYEAKAYTTLIIFGILFLLLFVPTWFLIRDFLYGMLLKIQRKIEIDDRIEIADLNGVVVNADYFTFDIKTKNGNINTIPYNKIRSEVIVKNGANIHLEKQLISFIIPSKQDINKITPELKATLINAPWVASSQEPIINAIDGEPGNYVVEFIVYIIKKEHADKIMEYVKRNFIDGMEG